MEVAILSQGTYIFHEAPKDNSQRPIRFITFRDPSSPTTLQLGNHLLNVNIPDNNVSSVTLWLSFWVKPVQEVRFDLKTQRLSKISDTCFSAEDKSVLICQPARTVSHTRWRDHQWS